MDEAQLTGWLTSLMFWPFVRIGALLLAAPLFGARTVPVRVRIALGADARVGGGAAVPVPNRRSGSPLPVRWLVAARGADRRDPGFLLQMVFAAMAMAGEIVALSMGLAFASMVDPERGGSVPLVGQYFVIFATLLFLAFDGHLALLALLFESFG
jgi:flagellar biosynthesis protein FliR